MAAHVESNVLDGGLTAFGTGAGKAVLCGTEPTNATEANSTFALASATAGAGFTAPFVGAPAAGTPNGRKVTTAAITGASVTGTGTANWLAILNAAGSTLYAVLAITPQALTSGNTWNMGATTITLPDRP